MTVAIVTDSNTSLPPSAIMDLPIYVAPLEIHIDGKTYVDGVDIQAREFYALIAHSNRTLSTSAPTPQAFIKAIKSANELADEIICITPSPKLSATYSSAQKAIEELNKESNPKINIQLSDSNNAGLAEGLMVLNSGYWAKRGYNSAQITDFITDTKDSYRMIGCLKSLDYLARSGRVPNVVKWMTSAINIKPIILFSHGDIKTISAKRSMAKAINHIVAIVNENIGNHVAIGAIMHSSEEELASQLCTQLQEKINFQKIFITELTPVIGAHVGPGLVGCAFYPIPL